MLVSCRPPGQGPGRLSLRTEELNDEFMRLGVHWYCHYNGSATNYSLVGYALAEALKK